jgi:hypothetical protein
MRSLLFACLLAAPACDFKAATTTYGTGLDYGDSGDGLDSGGGGDGGDGGDGSGGDGGDGGAPADADGDGWTTEQGDCDDADAAVHPDAVDGCEGGDEDCDDALDEDAWVDDPYEPNDERDQATALGSLEDSPEHSLAGLLHSRDDADLFQFSFVDDWFDFFTLTVRLSGVPTDATYQVTLLRISEGADEEWGSEYGSGDLEIIIEDDTWGWEDDGGTFEVRVEALSEPDCTRPYLLEIYQEELL